MDKEDAGHYSWGNNEEASMNLEIENLNKTYGNGVKALKGINLTIKTGLFGLLGPNGAGKSTLMRILATLQEVDSGSVHLGQTDVLKEKQSVRRRLGYLPQQFGLWPDVSAWDMLDHIARLKGLNAWRQRRDAVAALLQKVNLYEVRKRRLGTFSGGMRQRFGIAQALLGEPQLIIVDEPTAGLDPQERNRFHNLLAEVGDQIIVILSTHIVDDISRLCPQTAIISGGEILFQGEIQKALKTLTGQVWCKTIAKSDLGEHEKNHSIIRKQLSGGRVQIHVCHDGPLPGFTEATPELEDLYFATIAGFSAVAG